MPLVLGGKRIPSTADLRFRITMTERTETAGLVGAPALYLYTPRMHTMTDNKVDFLARITPVGDTPQRAS